MSLVSHSTITETDHFWS